MARTLFIIDDAVLKGLGSGIVAKDADVTTMQNQVERQQQRSMEFAIQQRKLNLELAKFRRNSAIPERGGVGWHSKEVLPVGNNKVALVQTGGIASLETAATDALTFSAPNGWTLESAELLGVPSSETFHADDVKKIIGQLAKFESLQRTATVHIETFPKGQAFAFKD